MIPSTGGQTEGSARPQTRDEGGGTGAVPEGAASVSTPNYVEAGYVARSREAATASDYASERPSCRRGVGGRGEEIVAAGDETLGRIVYVAGGGTLGRDAAAVSDNAVEQRLWRRRERERGAEKFDVKVAD